MSNGRSMQEMNTLIAHVQHVPRVERDDRGGEARRAGDTAMHSPIAGACAAAPAASTGAAASARPGPATPRTASM